MTPVPARERRTDRRNNPARQTPPPTAWRTVKPHPEKKGNTMTDSGRLQHFSANPQTAVDLQGSSVGRAGLNPRPTDYESC